MLILQGIHIPVSKIYCNMHGEWNKNNKMMIQPIEQSFLLYWKFNRIIYLKGIVSYTLHINPKLIMTDVIAQEVKIYKIEKMSHY